LWIAIFRPSFRKPPADGCPEGGPGIGYNRDSLFPTTSEASMVEVTIRYCEV